MTIQMVFLMPALFLVMFLGVQGALYYHAREVALAAAQEGAREGGSENGTRESGVATAHGFLRDAGGSDVITAISVSGSRTTTTATITVTGHSMSVIPGWHVTVRQSASVPVERLTE
ncbi:MULTISPECIES: TadE family protein [unclassified Nocardioides]|uniref:TadE family protein n=1 Tax=unclassified Nocardioides TaxID=2615069 RepID=UPI00225E6247|nr:MULTISPECIES: TadE family protein [unclassified Nocardioides]